MEFIYNYHKKGQQCEPHIDKTLTTLFIQATTIQYRALLLTKGCNNFTDLCTFAGELVGSILTLPKQDIIHVWDSRKRAFVQAATIRKSTVRKEG